MTKGKEAADTNADPAADLTTRVLSLLQTITGAEDGDAAVEFDHLLTRARELFRRKQAMEGTKSATRDLLGELMFTRLRRAIRTLLASEDARAEIKVAEWLMGSLVGAKTLNDFSIALDRVILEAGSPMDYSFAGKADFISQEEVLQMLGSGKHTGCLSLEKDDNRLDVYFLNGLIAFLDPHRFIRRVLPSPDRVTYREIAEELMREAEVEHAQSKTPICLTLLEKGFFKKAELVETMKTLGTEVLYEFLRENGTCRFFYRRLDQLPEFATAWNFKMGVTPVLLEAHKRIDDWRSMLRLFPDPDAGIQPQPDIFARISSLDLGVLEIKMLSMVNGEQSPRTLAPLMGLPLHDIYHMLARFARDGVLVPPGGLDALKDLSSSIEETMALAFEALDANDDSAQLSNALDSVFGNEEKEGTLGYAFDSLLKAAGRKKA